MSTWGETERQRRRKAILAGMDASDLRAAARHTAITQHQGMMEGTPESMTPDFGRAATAPVWAELDELRATVIHHVEATAELKEAAADFAKLVMVEHFHLGDVAVANAYERLRVAMRTA